MAIVEFTKDGQGFYNFDALLELTSVEFVDTVKDFLDFKDSLGTRYDIKIDVMTSGAGIMGMVTVYVFESYSVNILRWSATGYIESSFIMQNELSILSEGFKSGN